MLHVVKMIEHRFPRQASRIARPLLLMSMLAALIGLGLLAGGGR